MPGGFSVPGFEVEGLVSASATGEVWLARTQASGERVALKRMRIAAGEARDEARHIVSILNLIGHPHLLRVRELIPVGEELVFVLDHADGGSLAELLSARGPLDPAEVVTTVAPIAEALAAAHERGLVHGDVTPEHVLYTSDGRPLLADLGLLALVEGGEAMRTHGYFDESAPAQTSTPPGDVYGLAAVAKTALTGEAPKAGQVQQALGELKPDLPQGLVHAVEAGLQPIAPRRPTAGQFAELVYSAGPAAPIRFPVGLVLTDADLAKMAEQAKQDKPATPPVPPPDADHDQDPFVNDLGDTPSAPPPPPGGGPPASPQAHRQPGFGPRDSMEDFDAELLEASQRRRRVIIAAAIIAPILLAAAVVGGLAWARYAGPLRPPPVAQPGTPTTSVTPGPSASASASPSPTFSPSATPGPTFSPTTPGLPTPTGTTGPPPSGPEARWRTVLTGLDNERARAFAEPDPAPLSRVYVAGSELLQKDRAEVDKCVQAGCKLEGLRFEIRRLTIANETATQAVLDVVDQLQAYTVVRSTGERVPQPAGPETSRRITVVQQPGVGWLISRIEQR